MRIEPCIADIKNHANMYLAAVNKILGRRLKSRHDPAVPNKLQRLGDVLDSLCLDLDLLYELVRTLALAQDLHERHEHAVVGDIRYDVGQGRDEALAELLVHPSRKNLAATKTRRERERRHVGTRIPCAGDAGSQLKTTATPCHSSCSFTVLSRG